MTPDFDQALTLTSIGDLRALAGLDVNRKWEQTYMVENDNFGADLGWIVVSVPKGSITDLASVPRWLWWFIAPFGLHARAAVIHDHVYRNAVLPRDAGDRVFYQCMLRAGCSKTRAKIMWAAVRLTPFGWFAYNHALAKQLAAKKLEAR